MSRRARFWGLWQEDKSKICRAGANIYLLHTALLEIVYLIFLGTLIYTVDNFQPVLLGQFPTVPFLLSAHN